MRAAEDARRPAPSSRLVCTMPPEAVLPADMRHIQRSLAMLVTDTLRDARRPRPSRGAVLVRPRHRAAPWPAVLRGCPRRPGHTCRRTPHRRRPLHRDDWLRRELRAAGGCVSVLEFRPPREKSLFHAKIVAGKRGYLGTGNLSIGGFEGNVEVGLPLDETDVERRGGWSTDSSKAACSLPRSRCRGMGNGRRPRRRDCGRQRHIARCDC